MTAYSRKSDPGIFDFNDTLQRKLKRDSGEIGGLVLPKGRTTSHAVIAARASRRVSNPSAGVVLGHVSNGPNASSVATSAANNARVTTYKRFMDMQKQDYLSDQHHDPNMHMTTASILQRVYQTNGRSHEQEGRRLVNEMVEMEDAARLGVLPGNVYQIAAKNIEKELRSIDRRRSVTFGEHFSQGKLIPPIVNENRNHVSRMGNTRRISANEGVRLEAGTLRKEALKEQAKNNARREKEEKKAAKKAMKESRKRKKETAKKAKKASAKQARKEEKAKPKKSKEISWPQQRMSGLTAVENQPTAAPYQSTQRGQTAEQPVEHISDQAVAGGEFASQEPEAEFRPSSRQLAATETGVSDEQNLQPDQLDAQQVPTSVPLEQKGENLEVVPLSKDSLKKQAKEKKMKEKEERKLEKKAIEESRKREKEAAKQAKKEVKIQQKNVKNVKTFQIQQTGTAVESVVTEQSAQEEQEIQQPDVEAEVERGMPEEGAEEEGAEEGAEEEARPPLHPGAEAEKLTEREQPTNQPELSEAQQTPTREPSVQGQEGQKTVPLDKSSLKKQAKELKAREAEEKKKEKKALEESRKQAKEAVKQAKKEEKIQQKFFRKKSQSQKAISVESALGNHASVTTQHAAKDGQGGEQANVTDDNERHILLTIPEEGLRPISFPPQEQAEE